MTQGSYSRDTTIKAILSFYNYFATLPSLSPSDIVEAPPGGWPEITPETLAALKKNDDVIDLLKHLPYLNSDVQIAYKTNAIDYRGTDIKWCIDKGELEGSIVPVGTGGLSNYIAVLSAGHRYGSWLLLDTRAATVTDYIMMERPGRNDIPMDEPDHWRCYETLPIPEFFRKWEDKYRNLEWVTVPDDTDDGAKLSLNKETNEVRHIYRAHGWPDSFNQEECKKALAAWKKARDEAFMASMNE